jgi:hypothetical protein
MNQFRPEALHRLQDISATVINFNHAITGLALLPRTALPVPVSGGAHFQKAAPRQPGGPLRWCPLSQAPTAPASDCSGCPGGAARVLGGATKDGGGLFRAPRRQTQRVPEIYCQLSTGVWNTHAEFCRRARLVVSRSTFGAFSSLSAGRAFGPRRSRNACLAGIALSSGSASCAFSSGSARFTFGSCNTGFTFRSGRSRSSVTTANITSGIQNRKQSHAQYQSFHLVSPPGG